jgi:hypothetical protein
MTFNNNSYIATSNSATFFIDGVPYTYLSSNRGFRDAVVAASNNDWDKVIDLVVPMVKKVNAELATSGRVKVFEDGTVELDAKPVAPYLAKRIVAALSDGLGIEGLCRYVERLANNPSATARERLTEFLDACNVGITNSGMLGLYKRVTANYLDCHSRTMDNSIGATVVMPRTEVDDDHRRTCSRGLHVCSEGYLNSYCGERIVYVIVDPADVVAIPYDYNNSKMRVSKYTVVSDITEQWNKDNEKFYTDALSGNAFEDWYDDEDADEDYETDWRVELEVDEGNEDTEYPFFVISATDMVAAQIEALERAYDEYGSNAYISVTSVDRI